MNVIEAKHWTHLPRTHYASEVRTELLIFGRQHWRIVFCGTVSTTPMHGSIDISEQRMVKFYMHCAEESRAARVLSPAWWVANEADDAATMKVDVLAVMKVEVRVLGQRDTRDN